MSRPRKTDFDRLSRSLSIDDDGLPAMAFNAWTLDKLALLAYYLEPFAKICQVKRQGWYYVDAFAGCGVNVLSGAGRYSGSGRYKGTALIGLTTKPAPSLAVLVEKDLDHARNLAQRAEAIQPDASRQQVISGNFNEAVAGILRQLPDRSLPGFFMLDPYGMELDWASIAAVAAWRQHIWPYEQLIYFPTSAVERVGGVTQDPQRSQQESKLDRFFGTVNWRPIAEEQRAGRLQPGVAGERYLELYKSQLKGLGYLPVLTRSIRQTGGRRLYHLVFATGNLAGHRIMEDSLRAAFMSTLPLL